MSDHLFVVVASQVPVPPVFAVVPLLSHTKAAPLLMVNPDVDRVVSAAPVSVVQLVGFATALA